MDMGAPVLTHFSAAGNFPNFGEAVVADGVEVVVQVDGGAAVAGDKFENVAHRQVGAGARVGAQAAVLFGEGLAKEVVAVFNFGDAVFGGEAFEAGVGDDLLG